MSRYKLARAMGQQHYDEAIREDEELLREFGLRLLSVQGGLSTARIDETGEKGRIHPWDILNIDARTWKWLRPILIQARELQLQQAPLAAK